MKKSILIFTGILLFSCSQKSTEAVSKVETKTETTTTKKIATAEEIAQGKSLYATHCIACHKAYDPSDFSTSKWNHEVPPMAKKAKIDQAKSDLILAYVLNGAKK
jgi:mono/diheme cytochrome c family protein